MNEITLSVLNDDVIRLIISMIPHSALLPVVMTCKRLHDMADNTRDKSRDKRRGRLESHASHYCMTNSMVSWALSMGCSHSSLMYRCALYG